MKVVFGGILAVSVCFLGGMGEVDTTKQYQGKGNSELFVDADGVQPERTARLEKLKKQKKVWSSLDRNARKVITERAKYVYRFSDEVIIDAYEMMYWQREMSSNIVVEKRYASNNANGMRHKKLVSESRSYREDPQLQAYFSVPTYPCIVWYRGMLVNDMSGWSDDEIESLRVDLGVGKISTSELVARLKKAIRRIMPCIVVVDPLAQVETKTQIYSSSGSSQSGAVRLVYGIFGRFESQQRTGLYRIGSDEGPRRRINENPRVYLLPDTKLRDGKPSRALSSFALVPSLSQGGSVSALGGGSRVQNPLRYEVQDLKRYKMTPKELAVAFVDGEVQVPYREGTRAGGVWVYEEKLLQRPAP